MPKIVPGAALLTETRIATVRECHGSSQRPCCHVSTYFHLAVFASRSDPGSSLEAQLDQT